MSKHDEAYKVVDSGKCPTCSTKLFRLKTTDGTGLSHCGSCGGIIGFCKNTNSIFVAREFSYCPSVVDIGNAIISCSACGEADTRPNNGHMFFLR